MRLGTAGQQVGQVQRLIDSGSDWPISGDGIARNRLGIGPGGLIGMLARLEDDSAGAGE